MLAANNSHWKNEQQFEKHAELTYYVEHVNMCVKRSVFNTRSEKAGNRNESVWVLNAEATIPAKYVQCPVSHKLRCFSLFQCRYHVSLELATGSKRVFLWLQVNKYTYTHTQGVS